jgi:pyruvate formate lyase activating enzyme
VNDDAAHLRAVAALSTELSGLRGVEILPYHESGAGKYERLGRARLFLFAAAPLSTVQAGWREMLALHGCRGLLE